jgi:Tol biopolymer transport system component/subtilisin family serine protease
MKYLKEAKVKRSSGIKLLGIIVVLVLLFINICCSIPIVAIGGDLADTNSTSINTHETKVSSLLSLHIKIKQSQDSESSLTAMKPLGVDQQSADETTSIDTERVFLHFTQPPSQDQKSDLSSLGVTVFPDSWIPPVNNFKTGFVLADMPVDKLGSLAAKSYIVGLDTAEQTLSLLNDQARAAMNIDPVWSGGDTGAGVTVAVIDSGIDATNPDFPTLNTTNSRDYSSYPTLDNSIANTVTGHGTHVAGSLLGRGVNSATYKGIAPGANLVFLKVGNDTSGSATSDAVTYAIRDAVDVYHAKIINLSMGSWSTYHDGSDQPCQAVDYATSQGASVFVAAGNNASEGWHFSGTVYENSTTDYIRIDVATGYTSYLSTDLVWFDGLGTHNNLSLNYYDSNHVLLNPTSSGQSESTSGTESNIYSFSNVVNAGAYYLKVQNTSSNRQIFHIYYLGGSTSVSFDNPDSNYTIVSPAEADSAIAVGAYVTRSNWINYNGSNYRFNPQETISSIASYSSRGPRVDNWAPAKPEIAAPGSAIISVRDPIYSLGGSIGGVPNDPGIVDNDGLNLNGSGPANYFAMQGTSMASPVAAGVGALILDKNPSFTPAQVRQALESTAMDKGVSGCDNTYGYGLINANAATNSTANLISYSEMTHSIVCNNYNDIVSQNTAFLEGTGYPKCHYYRVTYYDGSNHKVADNIVSSSIAGVLTNKHTFVIGNDLPGSWHVSVSEPQFNLPNEYLSNCPYTVTTATFTVQNSVILQSPRERIAFNTDSDIYYDDEIFVMNSDGSVTSQITHNTIRDGYPTWSPDGIKIAFMQMTGSGGGSDIYCMSADGTNIQRLTNNDADDLWPRWSPDGTKIAFVRGNGIWVMNVDGTNQISLANGNIENDNPTWSPDGLKIMYINYVNGYGYLYTMNADGTDQTPVSSDYFFGNYLAWSPDGTKIAYVQGSSLQIYTVNSDGSGVQQLTYSSGDNYLPSWSPDSSRIVFVSSRNGNDEIYIMNADGSNQVRMTNSDIDEMAPVWTSTKFPTVSNSDVTSTTTNSAIINGTLSDTGSASSVGLSFDWGLDTQYSSGEVIGIPSNLSGPGSFTANLLGLSVGQTFHFRAKAVGDGTAYSDDNSFTLTNQSKIAITTMAQTISAGNSSNFITVQHQDADNNPIDVTSNIDINLTTNSATGKFDVSASGLFDGTITTINIPKGNNSASFYYKDTATGTPTIIASRSGMNSGTQQETIVPAAASQIRVETAANGNGNIVPTQNITSGNSISAYAITRDQYGNFVSNSPGTWSLINKTGNVANTDLVPSGDNKSATFSGHLTGTANIHVAVNGLSSINSGTLTVSLGEATKFGVTGYPSTALAGTTNSFIVTAQNSFGNASYTGALHFTSSDSQADLPPNYTFVSGDNGTHVFQASLKTAGIQSIIATGIANPGITGSQGNITINPATASQIRVESSANGSGNLIPTQNLNSGISLTVYSISRDQYGNFTGNPGDTTWSLDDKTGGVAYDDLNATTGASAIFTGHQAGTCVINASVTGLTTVKSGVITVIVPPPVNNGGGGGGGGGGSSMGKMYPGGFSNKTPLDINSKGIMPTEGKLTTQDGQATLNIAAQTKLLTKEGNALSIMTVENSSSPPSAPGGNALVVAYDFGPDGATFDPGLDLIITYDPAKLPANVAEKDLYLAYFDGTQWQALKSAVDTQAKTVTAKISHFSTYALLGQAILATTPTPSASATPSPSPSPSPIADLKPTSTPGAELTPIAAITPTPTEQPSPSQTMTATSSPKTSPQFNFAILIAIIAGVVVILAAIMVTLRMRNGKGR